jgi:hypothetical protein
MKRGFLVLLALVLSAGVGVPQEAGTRAWQQRLDIEVPLAVPVVELEAANPFAQAVDSAPQLQHVTPPEKLEVAGTSVVAAYVDPRGNCLGAVPLETAFPGIASQLVRELTTARFEPARAGQLAQPSWAVVGVTLEGKVKESQVLEQVLELPAAGSPPRPGEPTRMSPPGNLVGRPAAAADSLSSPATPKRFKFKVPGRVLDVPLRLLALISADGRCVRYVPLEVESGLERWLHAFLASWRLQPAGRDGAPVECWTVYTARVRMELSNLEASRISVITGRTYTP